MPPAWKVSNAHTRGSSCMRLQRRFKPGDKNGMPQARRAQAASDAACSARGRPRPPPWRAAGMMARSARAWLPRRPPPLLQVHMLSGLARQPERKRMEACTALLKTCNTCGLLVPGDLLQSAK